MNNPYIILLSGELRVFDMPVKPYQCKSYCESDTRCTCHDTIKFYNKTVSEVIKNAIKVENPEEAGYTIIEMKGQKFFYGPPTFGKQVPLENDTSYPLPKGLKVEIEKVCYKGSCMEMSGCYAEGMPGEFCAAKKIARLIKEPVNTEGVESNIKLTFYSGKLWHSDTPLPQIITSAGVQIWLSTAYEVVNPEVIPQIKVMFEGDRKCIHFNNGVHSLLELIDGDHITLPEGCGIRIEYQVKDLNVIGGWLPMSKGLYEVYDEVKTKNKAEKRIIATITLPEKPNNSPFDLLDKPQNSANGECPKCRTKEPDYSDMITPEMNERLTKPLTSFSEPLESQDELRKRCEDLEAALDEVFNYAVATGHGINDELEDRCRKLLKQIKS